MTALREEMLRISLLKVSAADLVTGNLSRNGKDRNAAPMTVVESIDEVQISWAAASGAHSQLASEMSLGARGERCHLFMADMDPFNLFASANRIRNSVKRISTDTVNSLHTCFHQNIYKQVSHSLSHISSLLDNLDESTALGAAYIVALFNR
jgi:hypothetical protein